MPRPPRRARPCPVVSSSTQTDEGPEVAPCGTGILLVAEWQSGRSALRLNALARRSHYPAPDSAAKH
jgi:hypothetical protein